MEKNQINNFHGYFSPSAKLLVRNTSCHPGKCDTSKVMNSGAVTVLTLVLIFPASQAPLPAWNTLIPGSELTFPLFPNHTALDTISNLAFVF